MNSPSPELGGRHDQVTVRLVLHPQNKGWILEKFAVRMAQRLEEHGSMETVRSKEDIEHIYWHDRPIATIIRASYLPDMTTFVTPDSHYQPAVFVIYPKGGIIQRHTHLSLNSTFNQPGEFSHFIPR